MKRIILITGGLGYLGGRLALALSKNKEYALRLGTHRPGDKHYPDWAKNNDFSLVNLDVLDQDSLCSSCKGVDTVIHLAGLSEKESRADPQQALLVNTLGTLKLVEAARQAKIKKFIYFSTIHVYGGVLSGEITEETITCPVNPYAITHRAAEDFVFAADREKAFSGFIFRLSNGFGAPADCSISQWGLVVNDLCRQAATRCKLVLKSSGMQNRDFISFTDIIRAVIHALESPSFKYDNCLFNLGGENSISILRMAEIISARCAKVLGRAPEIIRPAAQAGEIHGKINYRIDKFKTSGFSLVSNHDEEIDSLLRLCAQYFKTTFEQ